MYNEKFGDAIGIFSDILHFLKDVYDRKALFVTITEELDEIKWKGFPLLVRDVVEEMIEKIGDAITYSIAVKLVGSRFHDVAKEYARELLLRVDELAEWEYDRVVSLLNASRGLYSIKDFEMSKDLLNAALERINSIPDRSDRSDAIAKATKLLTMHDQLDKAISFIDDILYEPKKVEAVFNILDNLPSNRITKGVIDQLENKLDSYDIPIFRAKLADKLAELTPKSSIRYCEGFIKKIDIPNLSSLRDITSVYWCIRALTKSDGKYLTNAETYFLKVKPQIMRRVEERPFLEILINLAYIFIEKRTILSEIDKLLKELQQRAVESGGQNGLFILNRVAWLKWNKGELDEALTLYRNNFFDSKKLPPPLSVYGAIDINTTLARILNKFPDTIPDQIITQMSQAVSPSERPILEVTISRDALHFLREHFKGKPIGQLMDRFILKERIYLSFELSKKTKQVIMEFMRRGEPIVLHYILKFIHNIPLDEYERTIYLRLLGKAVELFARGHTVEAEQYIELILDKLERDGFPIFIILIEFLNEYLIRII
ncbi:MAG: hypothetical protein ACP6IP_00595 [Candidatus Njordarchaeia archaeon]